MIRQVHFRSGAALAAIVALAACGGSGGGGGGAMETGEWETTVEVTKIDVSNLPPEMREGAQRMPVNRRETQRGCWPMTADVVRIQNLRFTVPEPAMRGAGCQLSELVMEGGALRARISCTGIPAGPGMGGAQTMTVTGQMDGSYTPNSLQATASGEVRFGQSSGSGEVRITSRRIGPCPAPRPYVPPPVTMPEMDMNAMETMENSAAMPPVPMVVPTPPRSVPGNAM